MHGNWFGKWEGLWFGRVSSSVTQCDEWSGEWHGVWFGRWWCITVPARTVGGGKTRRLWQPVIELPEDEEDEAIMMALLLALEELA